MRRTFRIISAIAFLFFLAAAVLTAAGIKEKTADADTSEVTQNGSGKTGTDGRERKEAPYTVPVFDIRIPDYAAPGDPVFIFVDTGGEELPVKAQLSYNGKIQAKALFFELPGERKSAFAALALSTWLSPGEYEVRIIFDASGNYAGIENIVRDYPLTVIARNFVREIIPLDDTNTAIRTDNSAEKLAQIKKLNDILFTSMPEGIWDTKPFVPPVSAVRRTSFFGDRRIFAYSDGQKDTTLHYGIDYGVPGGTPVRACGTGRVAIAEFRISTGWTVVLEHLPGLYSLYYHMNSLNVTEGTIVERGVRIGESGSTGLATGPHLHWEIRLNGEAVHPDYFVEKDILPAYTIPARAAEESALNKPAV